VLLGAPLLVNQLKRWLAANTLNEYPKLAIEALYSGNSQGYPVTMVAITKQAVGSLQRLTSNYIFKR